jgi:3alpha(or 20beta)-hydroxysteroid dehydrogenase
VQLKFADKTVLITGGSRGQGAAEARMFAAAGARVVIGDVLDSEGSALVSSIVQAGGACEYRRLDVTSEPDWRDAIAFTMATFARCMC